MTREDKKDCKKKCFESYEKKCFESYEKKCFESYKYSKAWTTHAQAQAQPYTFKALTPRRLVTSKKEILRTPSSSIKSTLRPTFRLVLEGKMQGSKLILHGFTSSHSLLSSLGLVRTLLKYIMHDPPYFHNLSTLRDTQMMKILTVRVPKKNLQLQEVKGIIKEVSYDGDILMVRRLMNAFIEDDQSQRENIFYLKFMCSLIIDGGSSVNVASLRLVENLCLLVNVELTLGKYKAQILCDVVPMEATYILLGRPW
ncbi:hypothetical protein CR513_15379, partial [Mucuna pruriens]